MARPMFTIAAPATNAQMPDDSQLEKLRALVGATHPWLGVGREAFDLESFKRAFLAQGLFFRTHAPRQDRRFASFLEYVEDTFDVRVFGPAFLAACIASGEIPWQRQDMSAGRVLEVGLNEYTGATSGNTWRRILTGEGEVAHAYREASAGAGPSHAPWARIYRTGV